MATEDDDLPLLPGFREIAQRALLDDLVARRRELGISQGEVAARMGTSQPAVARLEAGGVDARLSTLQRYAAALEVKIQFGISYGEERA
ncbi:MAG TPA: helix-turn-helix domain-containing protein [Micromonosporaceae bacterium]